MQKNFVSLASFNALYLHISEKVLTHTHTHYTWRNVMYARRREYTQILLRKNFSLLFFPLAGRKGQLFSCYNFSQYEQKTIRE